MGKVVQADCTRDERVDATESSGPACCANPRWPAAAAERCPFGDEEQRARLIADISRIVREPLVPEPARTAALELIGWLARRFPGEAAHGFGAPDKEPEADPVRARRRAR